MAEWTMDQMIESAAESGFKVTARLITDWVELGLLDRAKKVGLGRGKGSSATWPEGQHDLFLALLQQRRQIRQIGLLCNVPVYLWLYERASDVSIHQVRRALETWSGLSSNVSLITARRTAQHLLKALNHPRAPNKDRKALLDMVTTMVYRRTFKAEELLLLMQRVYDPAKTGIVWTVGGEAMTPEACLELIHARWSAIDALDRIPDSLFEWARHANIVVRSPYLALANKPALGSQQMTVTQQDLFNESCLNLVTALGLGLTVPVSSEVNDIRNPATWETGGYTSSPQLVYGPDAVKLSVEVHRKDEN